MTVENERTATATEATTTTVETTATPPSPPAVATPPTPPAAPTVTNNRGDYVQLSDDHPIVKALAATKDELKTYRDKATAAEKAELERQKRYEDLLPIKIEEAINPLKSDLEKVQKALDKKTADYDKLQASYTGLETSVRSAKVQSEVKSAYLASGPIKEGADAAFDVIYKTHKDSFVLDGDTVKAGDQDLATFFGELKKAPVYSAMFAGEEKPSGTGTPPNKAVAGMNGTGVTTIKAGDMSRRNWSTSNNPLQDIIDGKIKVDLE